MTTITIDRAVVEQALEALENESRSPRGYGYELSVYEMRETSAAIDSLRAALVAAAAKAEVCDDKAPPCPTCVSLARTVMMDQVGKA